MSEYSIIWVYDTDIKSSSVLKGDLSFIKGCISMLDLLNNSDIIEDEDNSIIVLKHTGDSFDIADPSLFVDIVDMETYLWYSKDAIDILVRNRVKDRDLKKLNISRDIIKKLLKSIATYYAKYNIDYDDIYDKSITLKYIYILINIMKTRIIEITNMNRILNVDNRRQILGAAPAIDIIVERIKKSNSLDIGDPFNKNIDKKLNKMLGLSYDVYHN